MEKKKSSLWGFIKTIVFILVGILVISGISGILSRKNSSEKYQPFYNAEENFDVLFFGTSHGCNGFAPMELWDSHGIASYNLCQHSEYMPVTYYQVLNALEHTSPEVIVIDPYLVGAPDKISGNRQDWSYVHDSLDAMPLSITKIKAVMDLMPDLEAKIEFLFPFTMYHNRWDELSKQDYQLDYNKEKGGESRIGTMRLAAFEPLPIEQAYDLSQFDTVGLAYLERIIEACKERNVEVLLAILPYQADEAGQMMDNGLKAYAEDNDIGYVNLFHELPMNFSTDFFDTGHMNPSGYKKVADFLGSYLTANYELPDRRDDADYSHWYQDYEEYAAMQMNYLREAEDFYTYFSLLQNQNLSFTLNINGASSFLANGYVLPYLYNLGITSDLQAVDASGENFFAVVDRVDGTVTEFVGEDNIELYPSFGQVLYSCDENGAQTFQIGTESYTGWETENYIRITVYNNRSGQAFDTVTFYENVHYEWFRQ